MSLRVVVAPSGFKEGLSAPQVARCIGSGVLEAVPYATVMEVPMVDGGEGTVEALVGCTRGVSRTVVVMGPTGEPVQASFGFLGGTSQRTAIVEIAAAAGLRLVPRDRRDPTRTTSYGVGQLLLAAADAGAERVILGCGDSGVSDGGAGMLQALGAKLRDRRGREIGFGGGALSELATIDLSRCDARVMRMQIDAAVNWHNVLLGPRGVARVFGPQKGATPEQVALLEVGLEKLCQRIEATTGLNTASVPGGGASGGLGAAIFGVLGGSLHPRFELLLPFLDLDRQLARADMVITAEGSIDGQSPHGKVPAEIARRAKERGLPVVVLAGQIGAGARDNLECGVDAFASIAQGPCSLDSALAHASSWLTEAAEHALRMIRIGADLGDRVYS